MRSPAEMGLHGARLWPLPWLTGSSWEATSSPRLTREVTRKLPSVFGSSHADTVISFFCRCRGCCCSSFLLPEDWRGSYKSEKSVWWRCLVWSPLVPQYPHSLDAAGEPEQLTSCWDEILMDRHGWSSPGMKSVAKCCWLHHPCPLGLNLGGIVVDLCRELHLGFVRYVV